MMGHLVMVICLPSFSLLVHRLVGWHWGQYSCVCCCVFVFLQHINTISTGMLSLILVELHKMFRWFVSSIILHHAQYIKWCSNHSSSPWAIGVYVWMELPVSAIKKGKKKDKKRDGCFTCGSEEHWANKCPNKYQEARTGLQVCQCHSKQQWWGIWVW